MSPESICGLIKDLDTVINDFLGNKFWSLERSTIALLNFLKIISSCYLKSNLERKTIPRCLWDSVRLKVLWLKIKHGWFVFWSFRLKIISCVCLVGSGLKFIFHWNAEVLILVKPLFDSLADLLIFSTTEYSDVSSANSFSWDARFSSFTIIYSHLGSFELNLVYLGSFGHI